MTMTAQQQSAYRAAMRIGVTRTIGGATWTYYAPPMADGVNTEPVLTGGTSITGYVIQERLSQYGLPIPSQPVAAFQWRANFPVGTAVATGGVISNGTLAFVLTGVDSYQGFPTSLMEVYTGAVPSINTGWSLDFSQATNSGYLGVI